MMLVLLECSLIFDGSGELGPSFVSDLQAEGRVALGDVAERGDSSRGGCHCRRMFDKRVKTKNECTQVNVSDRTKRPHGKLLVLIVSSTRAETS